jgi:hypothetical protein
MIENIPPTENALKQHIKRAVYQAGYVWYQSLQKVQSLPCPSEWGWKSVDGNWTPLWTTIPQASKVCQELIRCGCLKDRLYSIMQVFRDLLSLVALVFLRIILDTDFSFYSLKFTR